MAAAKLTDTQTIRRLAEHAADRGDPEPGQDALLFLPEDGEHIGVVVRVEDEDGRPTEEAQGSRAWIVWLLQMKGDEGRFLALIVSAMGEMTRMRDVEVTDQVAETAVEFARERHGDVEFAVQSRAEGLRLVSLVTGEPGLCVRCRTNEPATTGEHLLMAPEGPVCAGCLNLSEQLKWGEAVLAALRKANASHEQIAEVQRQIASLRAEMDADPS